MYDYETTALARRVRGAFASWVGYPGFSRVLAEFPEFETYLGGGVVRNLVLDPAGKPRDFDIFLNGPCVSAALDRLAQLGQMSQGVYGNTHWPPRADDAIWATLSRSPASNRSVPAGPSWTPSTSSTTPATPSRSTSAPARFWTPRTVSGILPAAGSCGPSASTTPMSRSCPATSSGGRSPSRFHLNYATVLGLEIEPVTSCRPGPPRILRVPGRFCPAVQGAAPRRLPPSGGGGRGLCWRGWLCGGAEPRLSFATV